MLMGLVGMSTVASAGSSGGQVVPGAWGYRTWCGPGWVAVVWVRAGGLVVSKNSQKWQNC